MSPLVKNRQLFSDEFFKPAVSVALHYGFMPTTRIAAQVKKEHEAPKKQFLKKPNIPRSVFDSHIGEFHSALSTYLDNGFQKLPQPVLFYHSNNDKQQRATEDSLSLGLQIIGSKKSVAEAMLIKTAIDILDEANVIDVSVYLNTVGDRESMQRYSRELSAYFRKNIEDMPVYAQKILKKDPMVCLSYLCKKGHPLADDAPRSIEFLTEHSRNHFREVLEFLEMSKVSYIIDNSLLGQIGCLSQIQFEIRELPEEDVDPEITDMYVFARGGRYDDFGRRLYRMNIPAAGVLFQCKRTGGNLSAYLEPKRIRQPKIYFIQFGFEAKLRSLRVLEMLRKARVPIHQSLGSDKLTGQLQFAERLRIPYTIIMGHKEALEGTVIVRDMSTRSQNTVAIDTLPDYLKKIG